jgi:pimeloyl-ACP methyl ester carboxylesterase
MPVAGYFNGDLEKDFVVVHWDQRGAGKSNRRDFDESTMTFQQFIDDGHELTQYLKARFNQEQIYLVGHSWGTQVGIRLAQAYPEDYYAYVGVSQVVDPAASQQVSQAWLLEQIKNRGNQEDLKRLEALGSPPYVDHEEYVKYIQLVDSYGGDFDVGMDRLVWMGLRAPEYNLSDMLAWFRGANRGSGPMWEEPAYRSYNATNDISQLRLPVYFFNGRNDYTTPLQVTREYFEQLDAPKGKQLVVFEQSAHTPFMGEPQKFSQELVRVKKETYGKDN